MFSKTVVLFMFGATIGSAQFMPRLIRPTPYDMSVMPELRFNGCPTAPAPAPVICQFMQPNMGYKPPLIAPSTYIPPLIVEKCDEPHLEINLPAKKPIVIPEAPILPPITIPKFPVPVMVQEPLAPFPIGESYGPAIVSEMSAMNIPLAPALPPLEMPALPEIVQHHGAYMTGGVHEFECEPLMIPGSVGLPEPSMELVHEEIRPLAPIPPAPVLPPVRLPEIPVRVEIPQPIPIIPPPMIFERPIEEPCIIEEPKDVIVHQLKPVVIPQPPRIPEPMPVRPAYPEPTMIVEPCEPFTKPVMNIAGLPYFVRNPSRYEYPLAARMTPGFLPAREIIVRENMMPKISAHYKHMSLPYEYIRRV